jgi:hypothetical protein
VFVEQSVGDRGDVGVAAVERALAHAGGGRDLLHRHLAPAAGGEQPLGRGEDACAVAGGIGPLPGRPCLREGKLHGSILDR